MSVLWALGPTGNRTLSNVYPPSLPPTWKQRKLPWKCWEWVPRVPHVSAKFASRTTSSFILVYLFTYFCRVKALKDWISLSLQSHVQVCLLSTVRKLFPSEANVGKFVLSSLTDSDSLCSGFHCMLCTYLGPFCLNTMAPGDPGKPTLASCYATLNTVCCLGTAFSCLLPAWKCDRLICQLESRYKFTSFIPNHVKTQKCGIVSPEDSEISSDWEMQMAEGDCPRRGNTWCKSWKMSRSWLSEEA